MRTILFSLVLVSCGAPEFSPWQSNPEHNDLTAKHLARLGDGGEFEPFTIAISGDPQAVVGHFRRVIDVVNERSDVEFLTVMGDITDLGLRREWIWIGNSLEMSVKPLLTVVGNHDGLNNGEDIYKKMFGPLNYSYIYKDVKFIMWNNNAYEWGRPDFEWLRNEVDSHHRVIVMSHQPPDSGTLSQSSEAEWDEIRKHPHMIASIHGHVHHYGYKVENDLPVYTVDRVTGTHYGTITIYDDHVEFENCDPICRKVD